MRPSFLKLRFSSSPFSPLLDARCFNYFSVQQYWMAEFDLNVAIDVESSSNANSSLCLIAFFGSLFLFSSLEVACVSFEIWWVNFEIFELNCIHCYVAVLWKYNAIVGLNIYLVFAIYCPKFLVEWLGWCFELCIALIPIKIQVHNVFWFNSWIYFIVCKFWLVTYEKR